MDWKIVLDYKKNKAAVVLEVRRSEIFLLTIQSLTHLESVISHCNHAHHKDDAQDTFMEEFNRSLIPCNLGDQQTCAK